MPRNIGKYSGNSGPTTYFIPEYEEHRETRTWYGKSEGYKCSHNFAHGRAVDWVTSPAPTYKIEEVVTDDSR